MTVQDLSAAPNFTKETNTICHCLPPRKSEFEPFFGKIAIFTFPVTFAMSLYNNQK